jgi:hypothetical protein
MSLTDIESNIALIIKKELKRHSNPPKFYINKNAILDPEFLGDPTFFEIMMYQEQLQILEAKVIVGLTGAMDTYFPEQKISLIQTKCNTGLDLRVLSKLREDLEIIGYDDRKGMIRRARKRNQNNIQLCSYSLEEEIGKYQVDILFERTELNGHEDENDFLNRMSHYSFFVEQGGWIFLSHKGFSEYVDEELQRSGLSFAFSETMTEINGETIFFSGYRLLNHILPIRYTFPISPELISIEDIVSFYKIFASVTKISESPELDEINSRESLYQMDNLLAFQSGGFSYYLDDQPWSFIIQPYGDQVSIVLNIASASVSFGIIYVNFSTISGSKLTAGAGLSITFIPKS